jgi:hypothetical protein
MKLVLGMPWYTGPDDNTFPLYFDQMMYFGALRERSLWMDIVDDEQADIILPQLPSLDETGYKKSLADPTVEEWKKLGKLEIYLVNYSRTSLVGLAREKIVETAISIEADYLFWWDDDMRFEKDAFLRLWRHQKPVISALAFTARDPIHPVIFRLSERWDNVAQSKVIEKNEIVMDYPRDQLIGSSDIGGELALGAAVGLIEMTVFKEVPQPWFMSTGCGEDYFFSYRCKEYGIERWMDTSVKTEHLHHSPRWCNEEAYWQYRETNHELYKKDFGETVKAVKDGQVVVTELGAVVAGVIA